MPENPNDGHTLREALEHVETLPETGLRGSRLL
jgi:hypothetical protein